jgi:NAD(P)-dependent dehydrogenase (short-subunit alcohol dehydrogenase family)
MDLDLTGKRAIVTGGSRGIGYAIAAGLAAEGAAVALVARSQSPLDAAAGTLRGRGSTALALAADTSDDGAVRAMVTQVVTKFGGVDILVNAAAQPSSAKAPRALADLAEQGLQAEFDTKVLGYLRCARAVAPHMIAQGWGRIINISGLAARKTGNTFGSVRNAAVTAMTKNLADELGSAGVNVTVVHPGTTVTERTPAMVESVALARGITAAEALAGLAAGVSIGRLVTAAEVADVVTFLASPRSVAITGDIVAVGGGSRGAIYY